MESTSEKQIEQTPDELKERGNECVKENNFKQAIKFYSEALRKALNLGLDLHTLSVLFSNRSFAYLKDKKYFYALSDAEKTIELSPDWLKGYFRKAEVLKECCLYDEAILSYGRSLKLEPTNSTILNNLKQTAALCNRENMFEKNIKYVGAGCGIIFGVIIIILDQIANTKKSIQNPMFMVALVMLFSFLGFLIAKLARFFIKMQRKGLILEPTNLSDEFLVFKQQPTERNDEEEELPKKKNRYNKSQARLRFKKAMETIGDNHSQAENFKNESITFGIYLEEFKTLLQKEEEKLIKLETRRKKIESDMLNIEEEIQKEKKNFIKIITVLLDERHIISNTVVFKDLINSSQENESIDELISKSKHVIQNMNVDYSINIKSEEKNTNVIEIKENSDVDYMYSIKKFLAEKRIIQDSTFN